MSFVSSTIARVQRAAGGLRRITVRRSVLVGILVTALIVVGARAPSGSSALGRPPDPTADATVVHRLVFEVDLGTFTSLVDTHLGGDRWLDWTTDWCSAPLIGSTGRSFDFRIPCRRHDFAYRNTKLLDVRYGCDDRPPGGLCTTWRYGRWWNATSRAAIDLRFRADMRHMCRTRLVIERPRCLVWSEIFYRAVRLAGGP